MSDTPDTFLPYHEPDIVTILVQSSFLLSLNIINTLLDKLIFCGLLGQVFIGVAWGTPGAQWLGFDVEDSVVQLGYLGLILLVYEGGLETNFSSLKANLFLSVAVAVTGIGFPIALSFVLLPLAGATPVQAFAAGAALCSTSLGTTFTILSTSGLSATRLGTVLTTAAMLDDVVGLVMVQVISNLGNSDEFDAVTVVRPLMVSLGFAIVTPLVCGFVVKPVTNLLTRTREAYPNGVVQRACKISYTPFLLHTLILLGFVTASTYAGTSNLFAAYLAGASISWWDSEVLHLSSKQSLASPSSGSSSSVRHVSPNPARSSDNVDNLVERPSNRIPSDQPESVPLESSRTQLEVYDSSGSSVYHQYYAQAVKRILKPFFFASIGFAIPITEMFSGDIVWRGMVYTLLMLFAKVVTGVWLIQLNITWPTIRVPKLLQLLLTSAKRKPEIQAAAVKPEENEMQASPEQTLSEPWVLLKGIPPVDEGGPSNPRMSTPVEPLDTSPGIGQPLSKKINKPLSLYPAAMLGTAMTARGEIGFLIASIAETTGLFASSDLDPSESSTGSSKIYLVVTWAIVLCTIIGPLSVGTLVKRVRRLQAERDNNPAKADPLGIWGVS